MEIAIRTAKPQDAAGIARVRVTTWKIAYRGLIPQEILDQQDIGVDTLRFQEILSNLPAGRNTFVAEVAESQGQPAEIAGFASCGTERDSDPEYSGELYALYVLPEFQGRGIGRRLVQAAADFLKGQNHQRMVIYVLRDNLPSRKFYEAIGGKAVREKMADIRGVLLPEVGYGYEIT